MSTSEPINPDHSSKCNDLIVTLFDDAVAKVRNQTELNAVEERVYLLINMLLVSEMEGFIDLFHQFYSLRDCVVVEGTLRSLGLQKLADLFRKAKDIYVCGSGSVSSDEDFHALYFQLNEKQRDQIAGIGYEILAKDSEIYQIGEKLCQLVIDNPRL